MAPLGRGRAPSSSYDTPDGVFQRLITENVYQAVDTLLLTFVDTVRTSPTTVPSGDGHSYTLTNTSASHPGGLTNADYMRFVVRDARATNPGIRILTTLSWGEADVISRIYAGATTPAEMREAADAFATNLVEFLQHWSLDGFDVDWESPVSDQTSAEQFAVLFTAVGQAFRSQSPPLELTLSPAAADNLDASAVNDNVAVVNLQLYSGFTFKEQFTRIGIDEKLLAYGAKFESDYQSADDAYHDAVAGQYDVITQWRLNSGNFIYEQDQQKELHALAARGATRVT